MKPDRNPKPDIKPIENLLLELLQQHDPKRWAQAVLRLSDHYVAHPGAVSPWENDWAREALLSYYHPLNQARARAVAERGQGVGFFAGLDTLIDIGCGSAAASLGLCDVHSFRSLQLIDRSRTVLSLAEKLAPQNLKTTTATGTLEQFAAPSSGEGALVLLSYVLTETDPARARATLERVLGCKSKSPIEAIAILEPSTAQDARPLQALRPVLQDLGYHLWAPCAHQEACPLLVDSKSDWCHDRTEPQLPSWWSELEAHLPMKNRSVTFSFLLARRTPPQSSAKGIRVIGDRLEEKTKVRQLICRGPRREFISWFPSRLPDDLGSLDLQRGDLIRTENTDMILKDQRGAPGAWEYRLDQTAVAAIRN